MEIQQPDKDFTTVYDLGTPVTQQNLTAFIVEGFNVSLGQTNIQEFYVRWSIEHGLFDPQMETLGKARGIYDFATLQYSGQLNDPDRYEKFKTLQIFSPDEISYILERFGNISGSETHQRVMRAYEGEILQRNVTLRLLHDFLNVISAITSSGFVSPLVQHQKDAVYHTLRHDSPGIFLANLREIALHGNNAGVRNEDPFDDYY